MFVDVGNYLAKLWSSTLPKDFRKAGEFANALLRPRMLTMGQVQRTLFRSQRGIASSFIKGVPFNFPYI